MKKLIRHIAIFLFAHSFSVTLFAADLDSKTELRLENLKVSRAEMPTVFESVLVLVREDMKTRVTIVCADGSGPLQSTIVANFVSESNTIRTRVFSGTDFYCYGAGTDLTALLKQGQFFNLSIKLDAQTSPRKVLSVTAEPLDGSEAIVSNRNSSTKWLER